MESQARQGYQGVCCDAMNAGKNVGGKQNRLPAAGGKFFVFLCVLRG
jgi:hypothetical protein